LDGFCVSSSSCESCPRERRRGRERGRREGGREGDRKGGRHGVTGSEKLAESKDEQGEVSERMAEGVHV